MIGFRQSINSTTLRRSSVSGLRSSILNTSRPHPLRPASSEKNHSQKRLTIVHTIINFINIAAGTRSVHKILLLDMIAQLQERFISVLRWSEQYIKTDMVYLAHGGFWLSLGMAVSIVSGFGLSLAFGNLVSKEVFGNYKYAFSLIGLFGTISLTSIGTAVTQATARGFDGALRRGFRVDLLWGIPGALLTLGAGAYYLWNGNNLIGVSLLIAGVGAPLLSAFNVYASFLQGKKDFRRATLYGFAIDIVPPLLLIGLMLSRARDYVPAYIIMYYGIMITLSMYFYSRTIAVHHPSNATDPNMVNNAVHLSLINILGRIASYIDKILVFHFLGAVSLAIYTFAAAPPQYVLRLNGMFSTLALPKLAIRDIPTLKQTLPQKIAIHFVAALVATTLYVVLIPYFFQYLFPKYIASIPYAQALGLLILSAPGIWLGQTLIAHMRKRELYIINTVNPLIKISLYATLITLYGIWGVIWATVVAGAVGFGMAFWVYNRL